MKIFFHNLDEHINKQPHCFFVPILALFDKELVKVLNKELKRKKKIVEDDKHVISFVIFYSDMKNYF